MRLSSTAIGVGEVRGARRLRDATFFVGRVLLDAHQLIEELIDAEREPAELGVLELEALVGLAVEDREQALFEHVIGRRDVLPSSQPPMKTRMMPERHRAEDRRGGAPLASGMRSAGAAATMTARFPSPKFSSGAAARNMLPACEASTWPS